MSIQNVKGMYDMLPEETAQWSAIEKVLADVLHHYQYKQIRTPLVEKTALFQRSIGEATDVVEKEMYQVEDRDGEALSLRPEGTAGVVRAAMQNGLLYNQTQRLWYRGPMFRYEKPQKGRCRQFHQLGVEAFGYLGPDIDAEILAMMRDFWQSLGLFGVQLHLNTLGDKDARQSYRKRLISHFLAHESALDAEAKARLHKNPLRLLDSKNPDMAEAIAAAPLMSSFLSTECRQHFDQLCDMLAGMNISFTLNPQLVRGLDYYNRTVFEWQALDGLGAQNAICGGGRYDGLVAQLGGKDVPGIGFGIGMERLMLLLDAQSQLPAPNAPDYFVIISVADEDYPAAFASVDLIRQQLPHQAIYVNCGNASFKNQMKKADKSGAETAIIIGAQEFADKVVTLKPLRGGEQRTIALSELKVSIA